MTWVKYRPRFRWRILAFIPEVFIRNNRWLVGYPDFRQGFSVAIVTAHFEMEILTRLDLKNKLNFSIAAGDGCLVPTGTTGESPTLSHPVARTSHLRSDSNRGGSNQGHGRHWFQYVRSNEASNGMGAQRGADVQPCKLCLLQQANSGRILSTLQGDFGSGPDSHLRLQHSRRTGQNIAPDTIARTAEFREHHDGQRGRRARWIRRRRSSV